jgi:shikimate dehydrogenase
MIYEAFRVEKDNLESAIKGAYSLGIKGLNVTVPHKVEVMKCLCDIDKRAKVIGAVNTLKYTENGYVGYNTDIIGVYYAIKNKGFDVKGKTVLLLGAGGAGNACGVMAADNGAKMLYIANRTVSKADKLAESIRAEYPDTEIKTLSIDDIYDIPNVDIVLNATVIGFGENKGLSPIKDTGFYKAKGVEMVFDAIYSPWETQLLKDCRKEGITGINGFDMLVYQAVAAEEIWFDEEIDPQLTEKARKELSDFYRENN